MSIQIRPNEICKDELDDVWALYDKALVESKQQLIEMQQTTWDIQRNQHLDSDEEDIVYDEDGQILTMSSYECEHNVIDDVESGACVCTVCGTVIVNQLIDSGAEWRYYGADDNKSDPNRVGMPISHFFRSSSLSTFISARNMNGTITNKSKIQKLQQWDLIAPEERTRYILFKEINEKCSSQNISRNIVETAKELIMKIHNRSSHRGKILHGIITYALKVAASMLKINIPLDNLLKVYGLSKQELMTGGKEFKNAIGVVAKSEKFQEAMNSNTKNYIEQYIRQLGISYKYVDKAVHILKCIEKLGIDSDHQSSTIAASCVYYICKTHELTKGNDKGYTVAVTVINMKEVSGISVNTINRVYLKIKKYDKYYNGICCPSSDSQS